MITYEDSNSGKAGEIYLATAILLDPDFKFDPIDKEEIAKVSLVPIEEAMKRGAMSPRMHRVAATASAQDRTPSASTSLNE